MKIKKKDKIKIQKFIKFLKSKEKIKCSFRDLSFDDKNNKNYDIYFRVVPENFGITDIPSIKKYCKIFGLNIKNEFKQDFLRRNGYQDYHECYLTINDNYEKKIDIKKLR